MSDTRIRIFHNPACGTSRNTLLMNRPIVTTPLGTRLCRPSEAVLDILPSLQQAPVGDEVVEPVMNATALEKTRHVAS